MFAYKATFEWTMSNESVNAVGEPGESTSQEELYGAELCDSMV
jgi:hypothetical protein